MRHRVAYRKLGRVTEHRLAMLRNLSENLLRHERIETTVPRAKELRPFVERLITLAKRGLAAGDPARAVTARRLVRRDIADLAVVAKLFDAVAPRFAERPGGYTRMLRIGFRRGDSADMAQVELVGSEFNPAAKAGEGEGGAPQKPAGVGGRLRAAARRLRGRPADGAEGAEVRAARAEDSKAKAAGARSKTKSVKRTSGKKIGS